MLIDHDTRVLGLFSVLVAVLASYAALDMARPCYRAGGSASPLAAVGGAFVMWIDTWLCASELY